MKTKITNVRIAFPSLFTEDKFGHFSARFIFEKDSSAEKEVLKAIEEAGKEKWAAKWPQVKKTLSNSDKLGVHDGENHADTRPEYSGMSYVNAKNKIQPVVKDRSAATVFKEGLVYGGCRVDAILDVYGGQHPTGGNYISIQLLGVQFRGDDDAFVAGSRAEDSDFESIAEGADADDL